MTSKVRRPALRYHGGKWMLAPWIISHFPPHRVYVEPFGGGASVLLRKPRSYAEIYNDLDGEVVNFFRMMQTRGDELVRMLHLTPFARAEFELAYQHTDDPLEQARRLVIRCFMGFGSDGHNTAKPTGFRSNSNRSGNTPAADWRNLPDAHMDIIERLRGVVIENRPARECMLQHDAPDSLHYIDPPYVHETRASKGKGYKFEMDNEQHADLLEFITTLKGAVILSGYACDLYDSGLRGWRRMDRKAYADGAKARTESLWLNDKAARSLSERPLDLFEVPTP